MAKLETTRETARESVLRRASQILRRLGTPSVVESQVLELVESADRQGVLVSCSPVGGAAGARSLSRNFIKRDEESTSGAVYL